ncbi:hypothetical protein N9L07_00740 [Flavobacteriaceae bacterium]|nr:hypothetical protein [Flavobacteriaceae bacterium]MDA8993165.1 hypothetical protein [Flavobacteriaceae bacterium]MDC1057017.1 hypothetical protein [Flavobacteriaceae bacterium]
MENSEDILKKIDKRFKELKIMIDDIILERKRGANNNSSIPVVYQTENDVKDLAYKIKTLNEKYIDVLKVELENYFSEKENISNKLRLTLLYKLGVIDHLRNYESIKSNDRALSRLLNILLEAGKPDTFQTYLSAERSGDLSGAKQNNPLSKNLIEKAEDILSKTDLTNSELKKYYPL